MDSCAEEALMQKGETELDVRVKASKTTWGHVFNLVGRMKKTGAGFARNRGEETGAELAAERRLVGCCWESFATWLVAWLVARHCAPRWLGVAQRSGVAGRVETRQAGNCNNGLRCCVLFCGAAACCFVVCCSF